jgi:hypothetical protein
MEIPLRAALIGWLAADPVLPAHLNAIAEEAPSRTALPWLALAASASADWSTKTAKGREVRVALELHCRGDRADAAAGVRSVSVSAAGIFLGSAAEARVRANAMAGTLDDYELSFEDGEKLRGRFLIQRLDYSGDFNGERNYSLNLESSGAVVPA